MTTPANASDAYKKEITTIVGNSFNVDNYTAPQLAIDAAVSSGGGKVIFPPGVYTVSRVNPGTLDYCLIVEGSNIEIHLSAGAEIKLADADVGVGDSVLVLQVGDGSTAYKNISITGTGTINGNRANQTDTGVATPISNRANIRGIGPLVNFRVEGISTIGSLGDGIYVRGDAVGESVTKIDYCSIKNIIVEDCAEGILGSLIEHWDVIGNLVRDIQGTGSQDGIEPSNIDYFNISNNTIENINTSGIDLFGPITKGIVTGNNISNVGIAFGDGITWGGAAVSSAATELTIANNIVDTIGTTGYGITTIQDTDNDNANVIVTGNIVSNANVGGIRVYIGNSNCIVDSNITFNNQKSGIEVRGDKFIVSNNQVFNNNLEEAAAGSGINVSSATGGIITGNTVFDNQGTKTQAYGINIQAGATGIDIANNNITDNTTYGIFLGGNNNSLSGNHVFDNGASQGIRITGDSNKLMNNIVEAVGISITYGILIAGDSNQITFNNISGHTTTEIQDNGASNIVTTNLEDGLIV